jgi:hypothetical protein
MLVDSTMLVLWHAADCLMQYINFHHNLHLKKNIFNIFHFSSAMLVDSIIKMS